jgi:hypothetical protein
MILEKNNRYMIVNPDGTTDIIKILEENQTHVKVVWEKNPSKTTQWVETANFISNHKINSLIENNNKYNSSNMLLS